VKSNANASVSIGVLLIYNLLKNFLFAIQDKKPARDQTDWSVFFEKR